MILGFDTATPATTVALWDRGGAPALEARDDPPAGARPAHTEKLLALIAELLARGEIDWEQIERIAVGVGPGTFTGLRIGIATARALGQARGIALVGVSTLESLAFGAREHTAACVLSVIDARRGEAFAAAWSLPQLTPVAPARALAPEALAAVAGKLDQSPVAVGDGAIKFRQVLERSGASVPEDGSELHRVSALNHCRLAGTRGESAPDQIRPEYLRLPDADLLRRADPQR